MKKIKEEAFSDGSIGEYYATGEYSDGLPSAVFFWQGNDIPTRLCLNTSSYAYTHGGKIFKKACDRFPEGYSQDGGDCMP